MLKDYAVVNGVPVEDVVVSDFLKCYDNIIICGSYQNARTAKKALGRTGLKILRFGKVHVVATKMQADLIVFDWKTFVYKHELQLVTHTGVFIF